MWIQRLTLTGWTRSHGSQKRLASSTSAWVCLSNYRAPQRGCPSLSAMDTWQLEFNTVGDLTSKCMPPLVFKFAQKAMSDRASGVYLCNMMPKRMQIVRARGRGSNGFGTIVSTDQTKAPFAYWAEEMRRILNSHRGHVLVLLGSANRDTYAKWVRGRLVDADPISCPETAGSERVAAWFEYDTVSDQRRIRRVVLANIYAGEVSTRPALLSSTN
jgi:hypothetical protein